MKKSAGAAVRFLLPIALASFLFGCAAVKGTLKGEEPAAETPAEEPPPVKPPAEEVRPARAPAAQDPFAAFPGQFRERALEHERSGDLREALEAWRVVSAMRPQDEEAARRTAALNDRLVNTAETHYQKGLAHRAEGAIEAARREFLLALAFDPDHTRALDYLKNRLQEDVVLYHVAEGDTLEGIAGKIYQDPGKALLIARLNDLDLEDTPSPGIILTLPLLNGSYPIGRREKAEKPAEPPRQPPAEAVVPSLPPPATEAEPPTPELDAGAMMLAKATGLFEDQLYRETLSIAGQIPREGPDGERAQALINASYYELGKDLGRKERYREALEMLKKADPDYKDTGEIIQTLEKLRRDKAEEHYIAGVKYFINQDLEKSIEEWEETLALNPDHPKAAEDLEKARNLLEKLQEMK